MKRYRKIEIKCPGLKSFQTTFLVALFSGRFIFGGVYYRRKFWASKQVGLDNKDRFNTNIKA